MYRKKGSMGARIGAYLLDNLIIGVICSWMVLVPYLFVSYPLIVFLYYGLCEGSSMSASLGKRACGLIVVDESGAPLSYGTAFLRALCRLLSAMILGIGFIIGLFDEEGRTLHDRMAKTFVADRSAVTPGYTCGDPLPHSGYPGGGRNMTPQIIGLTGQFAGKSFPVYPYGTTLGTDASVCELSFPPRTPGISRNHCKIQFNPQTQMFVLYDMGSSYGTFLGNGVRVPQGQPMALKPGDDFYLASRAVQFRVSL